MTERITDAHEDRKLEIYPDQQHAHVPEYYTYLKVYGCYHDDDPVVVVVVEELKRAA